MSTPFIFFYVPTDPAFLQAYARVSIVHSHLDFILKMTIKSFTGVTPEEARFATAYQTAGLLRKRIRKLARSTLGECTELVKLQALLERCARATAKRNDLVHDIVAMELDGAALMQTIDGSRPLPTVEELNELEKELTICYRTLNGARMEEGQWLFDAIEKARAKRRR